MSRTPIIALLLAATTLLAGCDMLMGGGGNASGQSSSPSVASQTTIIALQTWLMVEQNKARTAGNTSRANAAGNIMGSLGALRVESNCARRLQLATAVSGGLQGEFPNYQAELGLGTNLVNVLASGFPGCQ